MGSFSYFGAEGHDFSPLKKEKYHLIRACGSIHDHLRFVLRVLEQLGVPSFENRLLNGNEKVHPIEPTRTQMNKLPISALERRF